MALLEKVATRFAASLDDYERVSVTDIGGWGPDGFWVVVRDHRFERDYEIASHCDYWDFHRRAGRPPAVCGPEGGGVMAVIDRFAVRVRVLVDATDTDEGALMIERELAGKFDSELVPVVETESGSR